MSHPTYHFLLPGIGGRWWSGGADVLLKLARLVAEHRTVNAVTYAEAHADHPSLDTALANASAGDVWVYTTGIDVPSLDRRLTPRRRVYYAQETGWRLELPADVPIIATTRSAIAQLSRQVPGNPMALLPIALDPDVINQNVPRDIDILFLTRKASAYLREELVPELGARCRVEVVDRFVPRDELLRLYSRSRVYLYDSSSSFGDGVYEGFGIQPLEALVCGCHVVSNLVGGMVDYLDPGRNCDILRMVLREDVEVCLEAIRKPAPSPAIGASLRETYSESALRDRLATLIPWMERMTEDRGDERRQEISRRVDAARHDADQPLQAEIKARGDIIAALHHELQAKVGERDATILALQDELQTKVAERDALIRSLQSEMHAKVHERDALIRSLQAEMQAKVEERDEMIRALQTRNH